MSTKLQMRARVERALNKKTQLQYPTLRESLVEMKTLDRNDLLKIGTMRALRLHTSLQRLDQHPSATSAQVLAVYDYHSYLEEQFNERRAKQILEENRLAAEAASVSVQTVDTAVGAVIDTTVE